jgi:hypothetical protein
MQFAQLDAVRESRQAHAFAALARRQNVADAYDKQVQAYQAAANSKDSKKRKSASSMVKDLKAGCAIAGQGGRRVLEGAGGRGGRWSSRPSPGPEPQGQGRLVG